MDAGWQIHLVGFRPGRRTPSLASVCDECRRLRHTRPGQRQWRLVLAPTAALTCHRPGPGSYFALACPDLASATFLLPAGAFSRVTTRDGVNPPPVCPPTACFAAPHPSLTVTG